MSIVNNMFVILQGELPFIKIASLKLLQTMSLNWECELSALVKFPNVFAFDNNTFEISALFTVQLKSGSCKVWTVLFPLNPILAIVQFEIFPVNIDAFVPPIKTRVVLYLSYPINVALFGSVNDFTI